MNIDMQSYLDALQSTDITNELINQKLQMEQQKQESTMPLSELTLGEGAKMLGEQAFSYIKTQGTQMIKSGIRTKLQDAGVDEDSINNLLDGDLNVDTISSKVGSLISQAKAKAQSIASDIQGQAEDIANKVQSNVEGVISDVQGQAEDIANQVSSQAEDITNQVSSYVRGLQNTLTDNLDNLTSTARNTLEDAQGVMDDLTSQSMQEYNSIMQAGRTVYSETETGTSNLFSRISNLFQPQQIEPQDIEMVDFSNIAPELSSTIAPELSSTIAPTIDNLLSTGSSLLQTATDTIGGAIGTATEAISGASEAISGVTAGLETASIGLDATGVLAPLGALASVALGIFGIVESEKEPTGPTGILNPSSQFL